MKQPKDRLATKVIQLTTACPYDQCNPEFCPLYEVRKMTLDERIEWICRLTQEDVEYLTTYHQVCLQWRSETDPAPIVKVVCSFCGATLQEGFDPPSHGVCVDCFLLVFSKPK